MPTFLAGALGDVSTLSCFECNDFREPGSCPQGSTADLDAAHADPDRFGVYENLNPVVCSLAYSADSGKIFHQV